MIEKSGLVCSNCDCPVEWKEILAEKDVVIAEFVKTLKFLREKFGYRTYKDLFEVIDNALSSTIGKEHIERDRRMKEALRFYSNKENWEYEFLKMGVYDIKAETPAERDGGKKAREALKEAEK